MQQQQQQLGQLEEDLKKTKELLVAMEEEKERVFDELGEMKKVAETANMRLSEALYAKKTESSLTSRMDELEKASIESAKKRDQAWQLELEAIQKQHEIDLEALSSTTRELDQIRRELAVALKTKDAALKKAEELKNITETNARRVHELSKELNSMKESLANATEELEIKGKKIESLELELEKARTTEGELKEKEKSLEQLKLEVSNRRELESQTMIFLSETNLRVRLLEIELEKAKEAEAKVLSSLHSQTKQLEETNSLLEEAKHEVSILLNKVESLENMVRKQHNSRSLDSPHKSHENPDLDTNSIKEIAKTLKTELQETKDQVGKEGASSSKTDNGDLSQEMKKLRTELKLATEAEENSKKAMDDLALVLIEVTKENNDVKEKLSLSQVELENGRKEVENFKQLIKTTEKFQKLLEEAKKETDQAKGLAERLKLEAEDSVCAWNGKELEFVNCIKRAEEENTASKQENGRLIDSLRLSEDTTKVLREENCKLRDILKQALTEASMAKEAATIAKAENSQLKDSHMDKDDILQILSRENERLRINEAAALENIKELKKLLSTTSSMDMETDHTDLGRVFRKQTSLMKDHRDGNKITDVLNMTLEELKIPSLHKEEEVEDPEKDEMLKGSIFDADVMDSPIAFPPQPAVPIHHHHHHHHHHHRRASSFSVVTEDDEAMNLEDLEHLDEAHLDDAEYDKSSQRKKKALLRRFGELLRKTSFHRREPSIG